MADQWDKVGGAAPKAKDYRQAPWSQVLPVAAKKAATGFGSAVDQQVQDLVNLPKTAWGAASNFLSTLPAQSDAYWNSRHFSQNGSGPHQAPPPKGSPAYYIAPAVDEFARSVPAGLSAARNYARNSYGSPGAIKQTLATDPWRAAGDVGALASIPAGGEGLAARVPGAVGEALGSAARGARLASELSTPIGAAGRVVANSAQIGQQMARGVALDRSGNFTPKALAAVQKAFPGGEIGPDELSDPAFRGTLAQTMQKKGTTPDAVREAVLIHNGASPSRALATQSRAPEAASRTAAEAKSAAQADISSRGDALAGNNDPNALGQALSDAKTTSKANVDAAYKAASSNEGSLHPVFKDILDENVQNALKAKSLPATRADLDPYPTRQGSKDALDFLNDRVGALASNNDLSFSNLEDVRQELNRLWNNSDGADAKSISTIKDAFTQSVNDTLSHGLVSTGNPDYVAQDFANARSAYAQHANMFESPDANPTIKRALKVMGDDGNPGDVSQAQNILAQGLFNPKTLSLNAGGERLYHDLGTVLGPGGSDALNDHIRNTVLTSPAKPQAVRNFLDTPLGQTLSPQDQAQIRLKAAGQDVVNAPPVSNGSPVGSAVAQGARAVAGSAAGAMGAAALGHGAIGEAVGAVLGGGAEHAGENILSGVTRAKERAGAPSVAAYLDIPQKAGNIAANIGKKSAPVELGSNIAQQATQDKADAENQAAQQAGKTDPWALVGGAQPPTIAKPDDGAAVTDISSNWKPDQSPENDPRSDPGSSQVTPPAPAAPIIAPSKQKDPWASVGTEAPPQADDALPHGYAAGGGVTEDVTPLVNQLDKLVKHARRAEKARTEPLLSIPDKTVIKALNAAQKAMA
jgi:hypothetical protein